MQHLKTHHQILNCCSNTAQHWISQRILQICKTTSHKAMLKYIKFTKATWERHELRSRLKNSTTRWHRSTKKIETIISMVIDPLKAELNNLLVKWVVPSLTILWYEIDSRSTKPFNYLFLWDMYRGSHKLACLFLLGNISPIFFSLKFFIFSPK